MPPILWSAPAPPTAKHPHNMMLSPPSFTVEMVFFGLQASPFSSKHNDVHYGQTVLFLFHQTIGHFSKKYDLCHHVNRSLAFLWRFRSSWILPCWAAFQVMSIYDSFYCGYRYFCTCFLQHLHKVLCCCSGIDLHFSHQSTFISRRRNTSSTISKHIQV